MKKSIAILSLAILGLLAAALPASASGGVPSLVSTWAPTSVVTVMQNTAAPGADVNYWFKWDGAASTQNGHWGGGGSTFEFGWKDTGNNGCDNDTGWFGETGWPASMDIQVDYTEDSADAVVWMDNLSVLKTDIDQNGGNKEYSVFWDCSNNNSFVAASQPVFQSQTGDCFLPCEPFTTFSSWTMNYVPSEQGHKGIPDDAADLRAIQTNMTAPWTRNYSFEDGGGQWTTWRLSKSVINGNANQGSKYLYVQPDTSGKGNQINTRLRQSFEVPTVSTKDPGGFELGDNTNIEYEGRFRCPVWSPEWAGLPAGTPCKITMRYKTVANGAWHSETWTVPSNWTWRGLKFRGGPAMTSEDDLINHINTHGFPMDVDSQWLTPGL